MQLKDIMTADPLVLSPETALREAAQQMRELDSGVMPVGEGDRLVGMLTDRDITVRATAEGRDPTAHPCGT
jgi:CBS domain-containing protein